MKRLFKIALAILLFSVGTDFVVKAHQIGLVTAKPTPSLTVTISSPNTVNMAWSAFGDGNYSVTITDITANEVLKTFNTTETACIIGGPVGGAIGGAIGGLLTHTVRFQVRSSTEFIVIDVIVGA